VRLPMLARTEDGRAVAPPTIEFRLPDGSAHPHLVLAGAAQAMCDTAEVPAAELDALLEQTRSGQGDGGRAVPHGFPAVAQALARARGVFEAGGVFPTALLERAVESLGGRPA